jgi:predicted dehydrogenase
VWDHDAATATRLAAELGSYAAPSYQEALSSPGLDLAVVMPRPVEAPAVLSSVIETGIPAIAEKPLGLNADDVRPLAELAERRGAFVNVAFTNRLSPVWQQLDDPAAGRVVSAYFRINNGPYQRYITWGCPWMLDPAQAGGGCLRNLGIHATDAISRLAGDSDIEVVGAAVDKPANGPDIDVHTVAVLRFGSAIAMLEAGYIHPQFDGGDSEWRISTEHLYLKNPPGSTGYETMIHKAWSNARAGLPPLADVWDCYRAARLVDAIYAAASSASTLPGVRSHV